MHPMPIKTLIFFLSSLFVFPTLPSFSGTHASIVLGGGEILLTAGRDDRDHRDRHRHDRPRRRRHEDFRHRDRHDNGPRHEHHDGRRYDPRKSPFKHYRPSPGPFWKQPPRHRRAPITHIYHRLPPRHEIYHHRGQRYHFHGGRYYRHTPSGYLLVRPPIGLLALNLPVGARTILSAGITYNVFSDIFYRREPNGYRVVEPIRTSTRDIPQFVTAQTDLLNVRYGPDTREDIVAQVRRGTVLRVRGHAPGWLYVEITEEGLLGWVREHLVFATEAFG